MIGITGGIGSGKSTLLHALAERGYAVCESDRLAKELINTSPLLRRQIIALLGEQAFAASGNHKDGEYQTQWVAQRVFSEPDLLWQLEAIIHPAVREALQQWAQQNDRPGHLCFVESAILYEAHIDQLCEKVIAITAPHDLRVSRVLQREHDLGRNLTPEQVEARIANQDTEHITGKASLVINNDGTRPVGELIEQILSACITILN